MEPDRGLSHFEDVLLILIVVFSVLVDQSDHGTLGRSFAVVLFAMVLM